MLLRPAKVRPVFFSSWFALVYSFSVPSPSHSFAFLPSSSAGGIGEDIHEGKRTLMVIHTFQTAPHTDVHRLKEILAMKTYDQKLIQEAIEIMKRNGSIAYAKQKAEDLVLEAWQMVDRVLSDTHAQAKKKLKALVQFMVQRNI